MHSVDRVVLTDVLTAHGQYPGLRYPYFEQHRWCVDATLDIVGDDGARWGAFDVKLVLPRTYPQGIPAVFEQRSRIKAEADWHINEDGSCCIGPWVGEMKKYAGRATLVDWLNRSVVPFFANHLYKERHGHYRSGEYSHGFKGILEYYQEIWPGELEDIIKKLRQVTGAEHPEAKEKCFCGSGERYARCHAGRSEYDGIPRASYKQDLAHLKLYAESLVHPMATTAQTADRSAPHFA